MEVELSPPELPHLLPEAIPLTVLYEDRSILVVDKPQGMVVHPGAGNRTGTLVHAVLHRCGEMSASFPDEPVRPGIVHRLDKDTSGVIVVARTPSAHAFLADQFRQRQVRKQYLAVVVGVPAPRAGVLEGAIGRDQRDRQRFKVRPSGKPARTGYRVLRVIGNLAVVALRPTTGRSHQLRVHMRSIGCPILGDPLYGAGRPAGFSLMLHARRLRLTLPDGSVRTFVAVVPERFRDAVGLPPAAAD